MKKSLGSLLGFLLLSAPSVAFSAPPDEQAKASWVYVADNSLSSRVFRINPADPAQYDIVASNLGTPTGLAFVQGRLLICRNGVGKLAWLNPYLGTYTDVLDLPCFSLTKIPDADAVYVADNISLLLDVNGAPITQGSITRVDIDVVNNTLTPSLVLTGLHAPSSVAFDLQVTSRRMFISIGDTATTNGRIVMYDLNTLTLNDNYYTPPSAANPNPTIIARAPSTGDLYIPCTNGFIDRISIVGAAGVQTHRYDIDTDSAFNLGRTHAVGYDPITGGVIISEYANRSIMQMTIDDNAPNYGGNITSWLTMPPATEIVPSQITAGPCADLSSDGTPCDDGDACTVGDTCMAGACVGSDPPPCDALDECHLAGTCDPVTAICSNPIAPDGTTCQSVGSCLNGTCEFGGTGGTGGVGGSAGSAGIGGTGGTAGTSGTAGSAGSGALGGSGGTAGSSVAGTGGSISAGAAGTNSAGTSAGATGGSVGWPDLWDGGASGAGADSNGTSSGAAGQSANSQSSVTRSQGSCDCSTVPSSSRFPWPALWALVLLPYLLRRTNKTLRLRG